MSLTREGFRDLHDPRHGLSYRWRFDRSVRLDETPEDSGHGRGKRELTGRFRGDRQEYARVKETAIGLMLPRAPDWLLETGGTPGPRTPNRALAQDLGTTRADWAAPRGVLRVLHEEHRRRMLPAITDEQPALRSVACAERIDPPVHYADVPSGPGPGQKAFRRSAQFGPMSRRYPQIPRMYQRSRYGPSAQGPLDAGRRVARAPFCVGSDRDHAGRAGADRPDPGQGAWHRTCTDRLIAMVVTGPPRRCEGAPQDRRHRSAPGHELLRARILRIQSLASRSRHAWAVRGACSENPVRR